MQYGPLVPLGFVLWGTCLFSSFVSFAGAPGWMGFDPHGSVPWVADLAYVASTEWFCRFFAPPPQGEGVSWRLMTDKVPTVANPSGTIHVYDLLAEGIVKTVN